MLLCRICHAYGQTPDVILELAYPDFLLLASHVDQVMAYQAYYQSLAFHDPNKLLDIISSGKEIPDDDVDEELSEEQYKENRRKLASLFKLGPGSSV